MRDIRWHINSIEPTARLLPLAWIVNIAAFFALAPMPVTVVGATAMLGMRVALGYLQLPSRNLYKNGTSAACLAIFPLFFYFL